MAAFFFEGFVIVSADGMLADEHLVQPAALRNKADYRFFVDGLRRADIVVHGRNSGDSDPHSISRRRVIVTRSVERLAPHPDIPNAVLWNPAGATFEEACSVLTVTSGTVAVIGGPDVFAMFAQRYDVFWLSQAERVRIPGGQGGFPGVPRITPQAVLASWGLKADAPRMLDEANDVSVTPWRR
ncbi:MAG: dihydrofolate reductase [Pseudomonadota bacterium]